MSRMSFSELLAGGDKPESSLLTDNYWYFVRGETLVFLSYQNDL